MIKLNFVYTPKEPEKIGFCLKELDKYTVSCGGGVEHFRKFCTTRTAFK